MGMLGAKVIPVQSGSRTLKDAMNDALVSTLDFFRGRTHGDGTLKVIFQASKRIGVDGDGRVEDLRFSGHGCARGPTRSHGRPPSCAVRSPMACASVRAP